MTVIAAYIVLRDVSVYLPILKKRKKREWRREQRMEGILFFYF